MASGIAYRWDEPARGMLNVYPDEWGHDPKPLKRFNPFISKGDAT
jgi:hypothetical protein